LWPAGSGVPPSGGGRKNGNGEGNGLINFICIYSFFLLPPQPPPKPYQFLPRPLKRSMLKHLGAGQKHDAERGNSLLFFPTLPYTGEEKLNRNQRNIELPQCRAGTARGGDAGQEKSDHIIALGAFFLSPPGED